MSVSRSRIIAAIVRKDFLSLWPVILASLLLPLFIAVEPGLDRSLQVRELVFVAGALATMALTLMAIHQDDIASVRHDWLSRPIGWANLIAAKLAFIGLTVAAPIFLAGLIREFAAGHDGREAVLVGLSFVTAGLYLAVPVFVLGLVTSSLVQAVVIGVGVGVVQVLFMMSNPSMGGINSASGWIVELMASLAGLVFCAAALALLLFVKRPGFARATWMCGALVVMATIQFTPASAAIALQQRLFPGDEVAKGLVTSIVNACIDPERRRADQSGGLEASIMPANLPEGWALVVDRSSARYLAKNGTAVEAQDSPRSYEGVYSVPGRLTLSEFAPDPSTFSTVQWRYDISLLEPDVSRDLPVDGRRRHLPGVGFCEASVAPGGNISVRCFNPFDQPATVGARLAGQSTDACPECDYANYKPAMLEGFGGWHDQWIFRPSRDARVVTLTTYEARGHIVRQSTTTGRLPACPKRDQPGAPITLLEASA